jgi:hypothetical protein
VRTARGFACPARAAWWRGESSWVNWEDGWARRASVPTHDDRAVMGGAPAWWAGGEVANRRGTRIVRWTGEVANWGGVRETRESRLFPPSRWSDGSRSDGDVNPPGSATAYATSPSSRGPGRRHTHGVNTRFESRRGRQILRDGAVRKARARRDQRAGDLAGAVDSRAIRAGFTGMLAAYCAAGLAMRSSRMLAASLPMCLSG